MSTKLVYKEHLDNLFDMQRKFLQENLYPDVKIAFGEDSFLLAHKILLSMNSEVFKNCLKNLPVTSDALTVLIIPGIKKDMMKKILDFMYMGEVILDSDELTEFIENINFLSIKTDTLECIFLNENDKHKLYEEYEEIKDFENLDNSFEVEEQNDTTIHNNLLKEKSEVSINNSQLIITNGTSVDSNDKNNEKWNLVSENLSDSESDMLEINNLPNTKTNNKSLDCYGYTLKNPTCLEADEIEINEVNLDRKLEIYLADELEMQSEHDQTEEKNEIKENITSELIERFTNGEKLQSISKLLNIPLSTLHWHKVRLIKRGLIPDGVLSVRTTLRTNQKQRNNLEKAIEACKMGMAQNRAAIKFGVSKATLNRRMKKINDT